MIKITKANDYRLNLRYNGKLYSFTEITDAYESIIRVVDMESRKCIFVIPYDMSYFLKLFSNNRQYKHGMTYKELFALESLDILMYQILEEPRSVKDTIIFVMQQLNYLAELDKRKNEILKRCEECRLQIRDYYKRNYEQLKRRYNEIH